MVAKATGESERVKLEKAFTSIPVSSHHWRWQGKCWHRPSQIEFEISYIPVLIWVVNHVRITHIHSLVFTLCISGSAGGWMNRWMERLNVSCFLCHTQANTSPQRNIQKMKAHLLHTLQLPFSHPSFGCLRHLTLHFTLHPVKNCSLTHPTVYNQTDSQPFCLFCWIGWEDWYILMFVRWVSCSCPETSRNAPGSHWSWLKYSLAHNSIKMGFLLHRWNKWDTSSFLTVLSEL